MKKISEWFSGVSDSDLKNKLVSNLDPQWGSKETKTLDEAICSAFYWSTSPEGFEYWDNVTGGKFTPSK